MCIWYNIHHSYLYQELHFVFGWPNGSPRELFKHHHRFVQNLSMIFINRTADFGCDQPRHDKSHLEHLYKQNSFLYMFFCSRNRCFFVCGEKYILYYTEIQELYRKRDYNEHTANHNPVYLLLSLHLSSSATPQTLQSFTNVPHRVKTVTWLAALRHFRPHRLSKEVTAHPYSPRNPYERNPFTACW